MNSPQIGIAVASTIPVAAFVFFVASFCMLRNKIAGLNEKMRRLWHDLSLQVQHRDALLPKLAAIAGTYLTHEQETFIKTASTRKIPDYPPTQNTSAAQIVTTAFAPAFSFVEQHPNLVSNPMVMALLNETKTAEERIARLCTDYNNEAERFNSLVEHWPIGNFFRLFGYARYSYARYEGAPTP